MGNDNELDPSRVELGKFYPHWPEVVWGALTDAAIVEQWLLPSVGFEGARVGTHFLFLVPTDPPAEIACEVLVAIPGTAMTWSWTDMRGPQPIRWIVAWELWAHGRGTRLMVTTSGFDIRDKRQRMQRNNLERGWRQVLGKLGEVLERGQPR